MTEETRTEHEEENLENDSTNNDDTETMESFLGKYEVGEIHRGKTVEGTVVESSEEGWLVDVGYKCEGFLPRHEWSHRVLVEAKETPSIGDTVRVQVVSLKQGEESQLVVSRWRSEFDERWNSMEESLSKNEVIDVRGLRKVKGGLIVDCCGIEGFIPVSHLAEEGRGINPSRLVEDTFSAKVIERDKRKRRIVLSRRAILEGELNEQRQSFFESTEIGQVAEGTVSSITSFGAFVNLGTVEGLVHNTELSWGRNIKPREIVNKGDRVKVKIIGIEPENNRISLSIKQTQTDPWEEISGRLKEGEIITGKVTNLAEFGAFVEIEPGIEGLVHIGDISWQRIRHPKEALRKGQQIDVQILGIDLASKRISLGYKQLNDPWQGLEERFQVNGEYPVKVVRLTDFGAFVEIAEGIEGLIHVSQLSQKRVEKPRDVLTEGQEIVARIIEIKPIDRRIRLSMSAMEEPEPRKEHEPEKRRKKSDGKKDSSQFVDGETNVTIGDILKASLKD
ncbi:MAG: S1 RNA-binding domain-containing protein [Thermovirgaceae bacterium]|nr:S1 RNA-binding domain-containing protein [Thermovirgaceae bacterium]